MYDARVSPLRPFALARSRFLEGASTPRAFLETCLEVISDRESQIQAFVHIDIEAARRAADASSLRYGYGRPLSPIDGCPVGIKDIINTVDFPTQMNSRIFSGWLPPADAACVTALKQSGAIVLGKTVTTEFACGDPGPTRNPFDLSRTPGGSSSGSAAAVGSAMLPVALGTQTRASIIRPASYCGAYGFKPSFGSLNLSGVHPVSASLDHLGVIAASLEDAWETTRQIAVIGDGAPQCPALSGTHMPPAKRAPRAIARLKTQGWRELEDDSQNAFEEFILKLERSGVRIVSAAADERLEKFEDAICDADDLAREIAAYEMRFPMKSYLASNPEALGSVIREYLLLSDGVSQERYFARLDQMKILRNQLMALQTTYDLFLTLASSGPAPQGVHATGSRSFISPWTVLGGPTLALPLLQVRNLPLGVQVMGYPSRDEDLMSYAMFINNFR